MKAPSSSRTICLLFRLSALVVLCVTAAACGTPAPPGTGSVPSAPGNAPGVASPVPTNAPAGVREQPASPVAGAGTITAMAADGTVIPPRTEIPGLQATMIARATASPFPIAEPAALQTGSPSIVTTRRGGLSIELRLPGDNYLAGENGQALVTVRNDTSERLFVVGIELAAWDEQGRRMGPWPTNMDAHHGWPGERPFGMMKEAAPGKRISDTLLFQLPPPDQVGGRTYRVQAFAKYSRPDMQHPDRADNVPIDINTAPILLQLSIPRPEQYLHAEIKVDRKGYTLEATSADGSRPKGAAWGALEAFSAHVAMSGPLHDSVDGTWSDGWPDSLLENGKLPRVRGWVAARGYVPALFSAPVAGAEEGQ